MDYFENAIKQIHETTADLKADNDAYEARQYQEWQEWMAEQRAKLDGIMQMNRRIPCPRVVRDYQNDRVKEVS